MGEDMLGARSLEKHKNSGETQVTKILGKPRQEGTEGSYTLRKKIFREVWEMMSSHSSDSSSFPFLSPDTNNEVADRR